MKVRMVISILFLFLSNSLYATTPIEDDAVIFSKFKGNTRLLEAVADYVKSRGYRCDSISAFRPLYFSKGFALVCNNYAHEYEVPDKGGHWQVTVIN